jgi:hypothetical protein
MAEIQAYPQGTAAVNTMLVGTQMDVVQSDGTKKNLTRNFSVGQISTLITKDYTEVTRTLTNAEWLALATSAITIVPAQAGRTLVTQAYLTVLGYPTNPLTSLNWNADLVLGAQASYSNINADSIQASIPASFGDTDTTGQIDVFALRATSPALNSPVTFGVISSATITGTGFVSITVRYQVI